MPATRSAKAGELAKKKSTKVARPARMNKTELIESHSHASASTGGGASHASGTTGVTKFKAGKTL